MLGYVIIRDGLKESNVVTKTFTVNDNGLPSVDDVGLSSDVGDTIGLENDYRPNRSKFGPQPSLSSAKAKVFLVVVSLIFYVCYFCMTTINCDHSKLRRLILNNNNKNNS